MAIRKLLSEGAEQGESIPLFPSHNDSSSVNAHATCVWPIGYGTRVSGEGKSNREKYSRKIPFHIYLHIAWIE